MCVCMCLLVVGKVVAISGAHHQLEVSSVMPKSVSEGTLLNHIHSCPGLERPILNLW